MTKPVRSAAVLVLGLLGAACSHKTATTAIPVPPPVVTVSAANQDEPIHLQPGQQLEVRLAANITTGYSWSVQQVDRDVLRPTGDPGYTPDPAPAGLAGRGGTAVLRFVAGNPGSTHLSLGYARPWENVPPEQTYTLDVTVG